MDWTDDIVGGVTRLRLCAATVEGGVARRAAAALEAVAATDEAVIVDLGGLVHADSGLWIGIVRAGLALRARGGDLKLCGGAPEGVALAYALELHRVFDLYPDARVAADRFARERGARAAGRRVAS